jgi:hypothetical protein
MIKNVIIISKGDELEAWGSLTKICREHKDFSYHNIKSMPFPFEYLGWKFQKVQYRY